MNRRDFLKRIGLGATLAVVAPSVIRDFCLKDEFHMKTGDEYGIHPMILANTTWCKGSFIPAHVGHIAFWYGDATVLPPGWAICNGATISKEDFPELYRCLPNIDGKKYIPDLRGKVNMLPQHHIVS